MQGTSSSPRSKASKRFNAKDRVSHSDFGLGTIVDADERYTTIAFDENGTKKFMTTIVELAPSDSLPPVKTRRKAKAKPKAKAKKTAE